MKAGQSLETLESRKPDSYKDAANGPNVSQNMHAVLQRAKYRPLEMHIPENSKVINSWYGKGYMVQLTPATVD